MTATTESENPDVVLTGAGIMSATLGTVLKELEPTLNVVMFESLHDYALESSEAWNNAGTGHAANCELNYTPQAADGSIDISKALAVNTEFDLSRQLWSHLVTKGAIPDPRAFIESCPHMSFVWGDENVGFLRDRYKAMSANHCYHGMEYSEDHDEIAQWVPLVMEGRDKEQTVAATRMSTGTDIDYGSLTHPLVSQLQAQPPGQRGPRAGPDSRRGSRGHGRDRVVLRHQCHQLPRRHRLTALPQFGHAPPHHPHPEGPGRTPGCVTR